MKTKNNLLHRIKYSIILCTVMLIFITSLTERYVNSIKLHNFFDNQFIDGQFTMHNETCGEDLQLRIRCTEHNLIVFSSGYVCSLTLASLMDLKMVVFNHNIDRFNEYFSMLKNVILHRKTCSYSRFNDYLSITNVRRIPCIMLAWNCLYKILQDIPENVLNN